MTKVTGPLLSFGASGAIAKTQVYSKWRGIPYARRYVVPANPKTVDQEKTRDVFKWGNASWLYLPAIAREPWSAYATGRAFVDRNGWLSRVVGLMRTATDLDLLEGSPGVAGGLPATSTVVTVASGSLTVTLTPPTVPSGWALTGAQAVLFPQQSPQGTFAGPIVADEVTETPYAITFDDLTNDDVYVCSAWLKWDRGDGKVAYSISSTSTGTPTA